jgi:hypothetical protein
LGNIGYSTTSYGERSLVWAGAASCVLAQGNCTLEFDYFSDSEQGWDYLRVRVDGQVKLAVTGRNKAGRASIPVGPGAHVVRFSYEKDGSVDVGRDTAWVDNVVTNSPAGVADSFHFLERGLTTPPGWTAAGHGGGWTVAAKQQPRGLGRPASHSFLDYQMDPSTSWAEKTISFPSPGYAVVKYFVDSEAGYDYFRIKLNGGLVHEVSGLSKGGYARVNVPSPGNHTFRFEYTKDTSVDLGLDLARVDRIQFFDSSGKLFASEDFDGEAVGVPSSWNCGGSGGCWDVRALMPPRAYVAVQGPLFTPGIDGDINPEASPIKEYENPVVFRLPDFGATEKAFASLLLQSKPSTGQLFYGLRAVSGTPGLGDEVGTLLLLFDGNHFLTLTGKGECAGFPEGASANDRAIFVMYQIGPGQSVGSILQVAHYVGTCAGWSVAPPGAELPIVIGVGEKADNPGRVDLEAAVTVQALPGFFGGAGYLGVALLHAGYTGGIPSAELLPAFDNQLNIDDVTTWETLRVADPLTTVEGLENWFDGAPKAIHLSQGAL